ncbi:hypothetical protein HK103_006538 [Boothiomyces macroporosus]|uniref:Ankyrin repeat protein n=1 Tax=Boothiomyces macroporosus TaxID=261099 RepID=A0AAD5UDX0_9FUNG|nr:hypothetical protein HK103_006538 [Boothiomyces macroporosus]
MRFAIQSDLNEIPKSTLTAYKLSTSSYDRKSTSQIYPVQLLKDCYGEEAFEYALAIVDMKTFVDVLYSNTIEISVIQNTIQNIMNENISEPKLAWQLLKYCELNRIEIENDFFVSLLYSRAAETGCVDIIKSLMHNQKAEIAKSHNEVFIVAAQNGQTEVVQAMMYQPFININYRDEHFDGTAFVNAAAEEFAETARVLFSHPDLILANGDITDIFNGCTYTPESMKIFHMLYEDSRAVWNENNNGPIVALSSSGLTEAVDILLDRDDIDPTVRSNRAAMMAAWNSKKEVLKLLLYKAKVNPYPKIFIYPCRCDDLAVLEILMDDPRSFIDVQSIGKAVTENACPVINRILEKNFADLSDIHIRSVLAVYCIHNENIDLMNKLLRIGSVNPTSRIMEAIIQIAKDGKFKAAEILFEEKNFRKVQFWEKCSIKLATNNLWKLTDMLLAHGSFNPSFKKNALLTLACERERFSIIRKITDHPAFRYRNEFAPFHALILVNNIGVTGYLLGKLNFDPTQKDNLLYRTACKYASKYYIDFISSLENEGLNLT